MLTQASSSDTLRSCVICIYDSSKDCSILLLDIRKHFIIPVDKHQAISSTSKEHIDSWNSFCLNTFSILRHFYIFYKADVFKAPYAYIKFSFLTLRTSTANRSKCIVSKLFLTGDFSSLAEFSSFVTANHLKTCYNWKCFIPYDLKYRAFYIN